MTLLDRHILGRFLANFLILFMLMFVFATAIDLIVALANFVEAARMLAGEGAGRLRVLLEFGRIALDFQAPRFFQFYAYLHGMVAVGAMGFTLAQMYRHKELVAVLAAGISMQRVAMPFIVGMFGLSVLQLLNQELFLPKVAPLLVRDHGDIGRRSVEGFPIQFLADGAGNLYQAPIFEPDERTLTDLTILERDRRGRTQRRITADRAVWVTGASSMTGADGWALEGGRVAVLASETDGQGGPRRPIAFYPSDLAPEAIMVHRHGQFAAMLSLGQIDQMLKTPGVTDRPALMRHRYARFSSVLINVLIMWLALPTFLLRQPSNLLRQTVVCAAIALPAMIGAAVFMVMDLPGIPPAVGVFLPALVLIPVVLGRWTYVRS